LVAVALELADSAALSLGIGFALGVVGTALSGVAGGEGVTDGLGTGVGLTAGWAVIGVGDGTGESDGA
jgi:hypothetical protein